MKKTMILSLILLIGGGVLGGYLVSIWKDRVREEAVNAAVKVEQDRCGKVESDLAAAIVDNDMLAYQLRLGKISIDASRMNYGTAKDEAVQFFTDLSEYAETAKGGKYEASIRAILERRDQIVSDLSVGSPTAAEALQMMYLDLAK